MNGGVREAETLVAQLRAILRERAGLDRLANYDQRYNQEWQWLLGLKGELKSNDQANAWIREHRARIPSCLPASGDELAHLLRQAGLEPGVS
jgi:hypothetical protein